MCFHLLFQINGWCIFGKFPLRTIWFCSFVWPFNTESKRTLYSECSELHGYIIHGTYCNLHFKEAQAWELRLRFYHTIKAIWVGDFRAGRKKEFADRILSSFSENRSKRMQTEDGRWKMWAWEEGRTGTWAVAHREGWPGDTLEQVIGSKGMNKISREPLPKISIRSKTLPWLTFCELCKYAIDGRTSFFPRFLEIFRLTGKIFSFSVVKVLFHFRQKNIKTFLLTLSVG